MKKRLVNILLSGMILLTMGISAEASNIDASMYKQLKAPDYEALEIIVDNEDIDYTMDAYDGRVYITSDNLRIEHNRKESPVVLIYDETDNTWSTIWATFLDIEGELDIIVGDGILYFFDNCYPDLKIYGYNLETKEVKELSSFTREREERNFDLYYDGEYIWIWGGEYKDIETGIWNPLDVVRRWNIETGNLEDVNVSDVEANSNPKIEKEELLASVKVTPLLTDAENLAGAASKEHFYVFGDMCSENGNNPVFCQFNFTTEETGETVVEKPEEIEEPEAIMIVTTCVPELIGEDYSSIEFSLQDEIDIPIFVVNTEHFKCNSHIPGMSRALKSLSNVMVNNKVKEGVNILGHRQKNVEDTELVKILNR